MTDINNLLPIYYLLASDPPIEAKNDAHRDQIRQAMRDFVEGNAAHRLINVVLEAFSLLPPATQNELFEFLRNAYPYLLADKVDPLSERDRQVASELKKIELVLSQNPKGASLLDFALKKSGATESVEKLSGELRKVLGQRFTDAMRIDKGKRGQTPTTQNLIMHSAWMMMKPTGIRLREASRNLACFLISAGLEEGSEPEKLAENLRIMIRNHEIAAR